MITLVDNRFDTNAVLLCRKEDDCCYLNENTPVFKQKKFADIHSVLQFYSGKTIQDLQNLSDGNLICFSNREIKLPLYSLRKKTEDEFFLDTGNLMGAVCLRQKETALKMQIHSRFDTDDRQFFLNYLLSRVFDVSFTELISAKNEPMWDLLLALSFVWKFSKAAEIGLYKEYHTCEYNDLRFRGKLDLDRHIRLNYPLWDKIAYSKREITFDNPMNHLFRSALRKIEQKWPSMLEQGDLHKFITELKQATPTWSSDENSRLLKQKECNQQVRHPFFSEVYEPLRKIARMLLAGEGVNVFELDNTQSEHEIAGVLFDGSWLWEEYIATVLKNFTHAVYPDKGGIPVFQGRGLPKFYPDFRKDNTVLDTKYKRTSATGQRPDIHQVICYMFLLGAKRGGLIYPPREEQSEDDIPDDELKINTPGDISPIWQNFSFETLPMGMDASHFIAYMRRQEERLQEFAAKQ